MKVPSIFVLAVALIASSLAAQGLPSPSEFSTETITEEAFGEIRWHLDTVAPDEAGPLIVWLPGSGAMPYFQTYDDGAVGFGVPPELLAYREQAHFLLVDKPGVPFAARLEFDEQRQRPVELDNATYRSKLTKDNLVARAALAVAAARSKLGERATEIVIIGASEGAQYAFALARKVGADRVIAWGGIALPQYYDLIIDLRLQAERGEITRSEAQERIEQLYRSIRDIQASPFDIAGRFESETYRRWSGFGPYSAIDDMLMLGVPLLLIQGGADRNAPILNTDYAMVAFLSAGKSNLEYWVYPELDHFFVDTRTDIDRARAYRGEEVWARAWQWLNTNKRSAR